MKMDKISIQQGYKAMILFLENYYELTQSDDVGGLLGGMMLLEDESTADPAAWDDWMNSIQKVMVPSDLDSI